MRDETALRRAEYLGGIAITLADGRSWAFPGPREVSPEGACEDACLVRLLGAISQCESAAERSMGELSLAIYLLGLNYDLSPADYRHLLGVSEDRSGPLQAEFHELALRHFEAIAPRPVDKPTGKPEGGTRRFRLPMFRPHDPSRPTTTTTKSASRRAAC
jgi:hypothetical protein